MPMSCTQYFVNIMFKLPKNLCSIFYAKSSLEKYCISLVHRFRAAQVKWKQCLLDCINYVKSTFKIFLAATRLCSITSPC